MATEATIFEKLTLAIYDADGWHKTDGTLIPFEDVEDAERPIYEARAKAALVVLSNELGRLLDNHSFIQ